MANNKIPAIPIPNHKIWCLRHVATTGADTGASAGRRFSCGATAYKTQRIPNNRAQQSTRRPLLKFVVWQKKLTHTHPQNAAATVCDKMEYQLCKFERALQQHLHVLYISEWIFARTNSRYANTIRIHIYVCIYNNKYVNASRMHSSICASMKSNTRSWVRFVKSVKCAHRFDNMMDPAGYAETR